MHQPKTQEFFGFEEILCNYLKFSENGSPIAAFILISTTYYVIQNLTLLSTITENLKHKVKLLYVTEAFHFTI